MIGKCGYILGICLLLTQMCYSRVIVSLTIESYSNLNGTAYLDTTSSRKCCDGPQRASCQTGDTCDTVFTVCSILSSDLSLETSFKDVSDDMSHDRIDHEWNKIFLTLEFTYGPNGCDGASFKTTPAVNTNIITNLTLTQATSLTWPAGASIFVFITDDDSGTSSHNDQIDTLIQELKFYPDKDKSSSTTRRVSWKGKTSLLVSVSAWCDTDYYGQDCSVYCHGLDPMAWCSSSTGQLTCSYTDQVLIELKKNTTQANFPVLDRGLHRFVKEQVCPYSNMSTVNYPSLDTNSNTLVFSATCMSRDVTSLQLDSLLNEKSDALLNLYFPPGVVRGNTHSIKDYGEHIVPNVYIGVEILSAEHPLGTSFNGTMTSGRRRCCDVPSTTGCQTVIDKCDMQFYVCIGRLVNNVCVGAVTISTVYQDTTSLLTCGPALLDHTQGKAYVSHPMFGAMRLTKNIAEIQVIVKDSDLGGNSSDVIDVLGGIVSVIPGSDVTNSSSEVLALKNVVSLKLRLLFWCAPGHSGPLCKANNGTDHCDQGWHGDDCSIATTSCSSSPCLNGATCASSQDGSFKCLCTEGYNGTVCDQDVDECALNVCQNGATCQNSPGAFQCECVSGWDGFLCTDKVPGCISAPCDFGTCEPPIPGSNMNFTCKCWPTWVGRYCSMKVTCTQDSCIHGDCTALSGGDILCVCNQGYKGINCTQDIDECEARPCKNSGTCVNSIGDFTCHCPVGFTGKLCNETIVSCPSSKCNNHGKCSLSNNGQNHSCSCFTGFKGANCEQSTNYCTNVTCDNGGICTELANDFMCKCSKFWSGKTCDVDVNECTNNPCLFNGVCQNLPGSFSCNCQTGWTGKTCANDINECSTSPCIHGKCMNTPGTYECECLSGYNGANCSNKLRFCNETIHCNAHGTCNEQTSGYYCNCSKGYSGKNCEIETDGCSTGICKNNATCKNSHGSYNCTCGQGWTGNTCETDINECSLLTPVPCMGNGLCQNTKGSFSCTCFPGFIGKTCDVEVNDCDSLKCLNNGSCKTGNDGPKCACTSGWKGIRCETDIDECELSEVCAPNGDCVNKDGSYYCNCYSGWTGNKCGSDVNECLASDACSYDGLCSNSVGTFACACSQGWEGVHCEVQSTSSLTGSVAVFSFGQNVTSSQINMIVSRVYQFLAGYICRGKNTMMQVEPFISNQLQFQASCSGRPINKSSIEAGLHEVPNVTKAYLFPLTLTNVSTTHIKANSKSWISTNWPVIVGVVAGIIIITAVAFGCYRERKKKTTPSEAFANPAFSDTDYQSAGDYS